MGGGRRDHKSLSLLRETMEVEKNGGNTKALKKKLNECKVVVFSSKEEVKAFSRMGLGKPLMLWNKIKVEKERRELIDYAKSLPVNVESDDDAI